MDFSLNDIQQMLQDSAAKFVKNDYDFETRRRLSQSDLGYSEKNWELFAELGWLGIPFDEQYGGIGGDLTDMMVLQTELGRGLVLEPLFSSVILGGRLINQHGTDAQKTELLEQLICGNLKLAFAHAEPRDHSGCTEIEMTAEAMNDGYVLSGHKAVVLGAPSANLLIVAARTSGKCGDAEGLSLFLVGPNLPGVKLNSYSTNDGGRAADVYFEQVKVPASALLGEADTAYPAIQATFNEAIVMLSAEAVGVMEELLNATVEYCKVRKQFGQPIGNFQALQHRMADMFMECEQARSMLYFGAISVAAGGDDATHAASMLKVKIGSAGRLVGQSAVQLHGGMGVTDELNVGHFFKRITMLNTLLGSHDEHLHRLVDEVQAA